MKVRMRFKKCGSMKFVGHLDLMRYFQKVFRRAGLPVAYSKGFNPHQIMSFASPLGVGLTSEGEYVDVEVEEVWETKEALSCINRCFCDEIRILDYHALPDGTKPAMSLVAAADYDILLKEGVQLDPADASYSIHQFQDDFKRFYAKDAIEIEKKTKKSLKMVDIRPLILACGYGETDGELVISLKLSTGSSDNLKPSLVLKAFYEYTGREFDAYAFQIHRKDLYYVEDGKGLLSLSAQGRYVS